MCCVLYGTTWVYEYILVFVYQLNIKRITIELIYWFYLLHIGTIVGHVGWDLPLFDLIRDVIYILCANL